MKVFSSTTGKVYEAEEATYYRNMIQSAFMLSKADCELYDVFENDGKIVMVFPKWMHKKYIGEWAERSRYKQEENI
jgi:hypothetical protein